MGILYGGIVIMTHRHYGINLDETLHVTYGKAIVDWYLSSFTARDIFSFTNVWLYGGLYDLITHLLTAVSPLDTYHTRHLICALTGFAGVIGVHALTSRLGSARAGLIAAVMLLLVPRYYGHAMFNHKDIPFAVGYVWSLVLILRTTHELPVPSFRTAILTGVVIGATVGVRIAGIILAGYYILSLFLVSKSAPWKNEKLRVLLSLLTTGIVALILMVVAWPWAHANPILRPFQALAMLSDFPFSITTLFQGQVFDSADVPLYYAPTWLAIGLPEFLLLGFALSFKHVACNRSVLLVVIAVASPLVFVVITDAPLYNGLRHLLFVVPPMCALAALATDSLLERRDLLSRVLSGVIIVSGLVTAVDAIRLHPNQYVYFNRLIGGGIRSAVSRFDADYFANSHRKGVSWIEENRPGTTVHTTTADLLTGTTLRYRVIPWRADIILTSAHPDGHREIPGERLHTIEAAGVQLLDVIRVDSAWKGDPIYHGNGAEFHYAGLAASHAIQGNVERAQNLYEQAIELRPERAVWHYKLARLLMDADRIEGAIESFRKAIAIQPTYRAHLHMAACYHMSERYEEAITEYRRAIGIRFDSEWAYLNLGGSLSALGRYVEAEGAYQQALSIHPGLRDARHRLGELLTSQGRYEEASTYLEEAASDSGNAAVYHLLSRSYRGLGELDRAESAITKGIQITPRGDETKQELLNVGTAMHEAGKTDRAEPLYRRYLELVPGSEAGWLNLAILTYSQNRYREALDAFAMAAKTNPASVEAFLGLGQSADHLGELDRAETAFRRVIELDPENAIALGRLPGRPSN